MARALCGLLGLMAVETLITLLLEIYRPRVKGKVERPLYDSRLVGLLGQPEGLFTTAAQALDYQFGFKVSETWFFRLFEKACPCCCWCNWRCWCCRPASCSSRRANRACWSISAGWPPAARFWTRARISNGRGRSTRSIASAPSQIQTFNVGFTPDAQSAGERDDAVDRGPHAKKINFLVATGRRQRLPMKSPTTNNLLKAPPVSLIDVSIPVQFQITNVLDWAYNNADPTKLLQDLATREVVRYLAGADMNEVMSATARGGGAGAAANAFRPRPTDTSSAPKSSSSACRTCIRR